MRIRSTTAPTSAVPSAPRPRSRRAVAALALAGGLASAAVLAVPVAASAQDAAVVVASASADQAAAAAHWTPAARAAALAADAPSVAGSASVSGSTRSATLSASDDASAASGAPIPHPDEPFVGVLFYVSGGRNHACTASVVDTPSGDTIATAAHCLADRRTGAATRLATFIPGAQGASAPHGIWPVRVAAVSSAWTATGRASDDAGFARVSGPAGEVLAASVGAAEPVFGSALVPATGQAPDLAVLGYPTAGSATASLEACEGRPQHDTGGQTSLPCTLGTGAAGSPVLTFTGEQHAVVARPSAGRGVLLASWGADAERAFSSLQGR
ncbi:serine protease [Clavibacter sp. VKM Ac-2542]|uniref:trypsin-like serine peptidase n=1 Tax=Clavibacter sp. VKM Ac-2542 TaxID=2783811 RepID=UPI00188B1F5D|nr:serine protease [Clavibacter sp. VKM Ac-2542]MBF4620769.1 serine protease [Clavibacter sp. VKM Ac-2542]